MHTRTMDLRLIILSPLAHKLYALIIGFCLWSAICNILVTPQSQQPVAAPVEQSVEANTHLPQTVSSPE